MSRHGFHGEDQSEAGKTGLDRVIILTQSKVQVRQDQPLINTHTVKVVQKQANLGTMLS